MDATEFEAREAKRDAAEAAARAAAVHHIRTRLPRSRSTNYYLDRSDRPAATLCGAEPTTYDLAWRDRATKWTRNNACPACLSTLTTEQDQP